MRTYKLALIGFGNVGRGFAQILAERGSRIRDQYGVDLRIVAVSDKLLGSLHNAAGLDPQTLLDAFSEKGSLKSVAAPDRDWDSLQTIARAQADVVIELSPTDLKTGEPAVSHICAALEAGRHVITTNKGPIALRYRELKDLAARKNVQIGLEGTVMSGTPAMRIGAELLGAAGVTRVHGILNGTTNFILCQMQSGKPYAAALAEAQARGYAEADPTGDVEGFDAAGKLVILAAVLMGTPIRMEDVDREGITRLTEDDVCEANDAGDVWKLIASLEKTAAGVHARVHPERLPASDPLAAVQGATNAVAFTTDLLGEVTLIGPGAGRLATGYAILCDLLAIDRTDRRQA
jgi:homoserine dehydrogenase